MLAEREFQMLRARERLKICKEELTQLQTELRNSRTVYVEYKKFTEKNPYYRDEKTLEQTVAVTFEKVKHFVENGALGLKKPKKSADEETDLDPLLHIVLKTAPFIESLPVLKLFTENGYDITQKLVIICTYFEIRIP